MFKYKVTDVSIQRDVTIKLYFDGGAWANMSFVFTPKGENYSSDWWRVAITSDWGSWDYSWSRSGMGGRDIYQFMHSFRDDKGYFIRHFKGREEHVFNARKTCTILRKKVREEYPWVRYKDTNKDLMEQISDLESAENEDEFYHLMARQSQLLEEVAGEEFFREFVYEEKPRPAYFFKHIFPKFFPLITKIYKEQSRDTGRNSKTNRRNKNSKEGKERSLRKRNETLGSNSDQPRAFA